MNTQYEIMNSLDIVKSFEPGEQFVKRAAALQKYAADAKVRTLVLGVSGGVDSTTCGKIAQTAVNQHNASVKSSKDDNPERLMRFLAVRLPYGEQADEKDAQEALDFIKPDNIITVNIKPAVDAQMESLRLSGYTAKSPEDEDFVRGNIKARQRMIAQYAIANITSGIVLGTDHAAEAAMGFFTKHGDGAADYTPLFGLNKRQVRAIAANQGAPEKLVNKIPTADLEDLTPQKPDEVAYGVTYDQIDDFLEGKTIEPEAFAKIVAQYVKTEHKRQGPAAPGSN